jgi:uncharacterized protein
MRCFRVVLLAAVTGLFAISGAFAQSPAAAPAPAAMEAAKNLVALMSQATIAQMASDMTAKVWPQVEAAMRARFPGIDDATLGELRNAYERLLTDKVSEAMADAPAIYARYFTAPEMKEIAAFYRTPTGAKTLTVMPKVMADMMPTLLSRLQSTKARLGADFADILKKHGYALSSADSPGR